MIVDSLVDLRVRPTQSLARSLMLSLLSRRFILQYGLLSVYRFLLHFDKEGGKDTQNPFSSFNVLLQHLLSGWADFTPSLSHRESNEKGAIFLVGMHARQEVN